jgi:hypothetical protein
MCFSATASFTAGALLVSAGLLGMRLALKQNKDYLLFSLIPLFFGIQQLSEGLIWILMNRNGFNSAKLVGYFYLFYAFYFWPIYVPLSVYFIEKVGPRRKLIGSFIIAGSILGSILYIPILFQQEPYRLSLAQHSISYEVYQTGVWRWIYSITYLFIITFSLISSSQLRVKIFGSLIYISSLVAYYLYVYAFTSIWCYLAAILSIYIIFVVIKAPAFNRK